MVCIQELYEPVQVVVLPGTLVVLWLHVVIGSVQRVHADNLALEPHFVSRLSLLNFAPFKIIQDFINLAT